MHPRFNRKVWTFRTHLVASLAKWLVAQSPYTVPDRLADCLYKFDGKLGIEFEFDKLGMVEVELSGLQQRLEPLLWAVREIAMLNESKNPSTSDMQIVSRYSKDPRPDDDFIDITAVSQNMVRDLATEDEAEAYRDEHRQGSWWFLSWLRRSIANAFKRPFTS